MKKLFLFFSMILLFLSLSACDPGSYYFSIEDLNLDVISIELVTYENSDQGDFLSWIPNHFDDLTNLDMTKITVIETLSTEEISSFLEQLSDVTFLAHYYAFDSPSDICIKINYANGDFEILNCYEHSYIGYVGSYNSDGEVVGYVGCFEGYDDFQNLVNNYFDYQLDWLYDDLAVFITIMHMDMTTELNNDFNKGQEENGLSKIRWDWYHFNL